MNFIYKKFLTINALAFLLIATITFSCSQKKPASIGDTAFQIKMNKDFKDASKSPLKQKDLKTFENLDFFKFDSAFVVQAKLKRTPNSEWFDMKTTTDRVTVERVYGVLSFSIKGTAYALNVYQEKSGFGKMKADKKLFLPFLDDTNGNSTYGGGRYIDLKVPEGNIIEIDFNKAYNPYCAYNEKYSCPIVPRVNYLPIKIEAGVKAFKK